MALHPHLWVQRSKVPCRGGVDKSAFGEENDSERMFTGRESEMETANGSINGAVHSDMVSAGRTSYFLDVRKAVNGRFYMTITESRRSSESGFDQRRIFVFEENTVPFRTALEKTLTMLDDAVAKRGELPSDGKPGPGRCGMRWTEDEDGRLKKMFRKGGALEDIASGLERSRRAVELRLEKLGLMSSSEAEPVSPAAVKSSR